MTEPKHEPSLREVNAKVDGFTALLLEKIMGLRALLDERDKGYRDRDDARAVAVGAALTAAKEQTKQSFEASEKAIVKAEEAQKAYNTAHNDLSRKMEEQGKATMPRSETESRFRALEDKHNELKERVSAGSGEAQGGRAVIDSTRNNLGFLVGLLGLLAALWAHFR